MANEQYEIIIKSPRSGGGYDELPPFVPSDYQISYDSLAAANSGRLANGDMRLDWKLRRINKLSVKLPPHKPDDVTYSSILSFIQGQVINVTYYDYLIHDTVNEDMYCSKTSAGYTYMGLVEDVGFELVAMKGTNTVTHIILTPYTVTWKNWDGTVLATDTVISGNTPSYSGATPTRPTTAQYSYTFSGWSPTPGPISSDTIYTAQYTSTPVPYTVTVTAGPNGSVTGGGTYGYGSTATLVAIGDSGYTFSQWSDGNTSNPRYLMVTGNVTLSCTFEEAPTPTTWTITWYENVSPSNSDDDVPSENQYDVIGKSISFPFTSNGSNYTSIGWDLAGEMFEYNGGIVWEGSGGSSGWNYVNPNLRTITLTTDPALIFTDQDWKQFVYHNSDWNPYS